MLGAEYDEEMPCLPGITYYFYKIVCRDTSVKQIYIGKTKDFKNRVMQHKCKSYLSDIKLYQVIRNNGGWDNWDMTLYHKCLCDEKTSNYIEVCIMKKFRDEGFELLNCQIPDDYGAKQQYNIKKCQEHYKIKKTCETCGWIGSKMEWSHHLRSKRHKACCIEEPENCKKDN